MKSEAMRSYRKLEEDLRLIRSENSPGSPIEDPIIEEMARLWWKLSEVERETLDREGSTCWPEVVDEPEDDLGLMDTDTDALAGGVSGAVRVPVRCPKCGAPASQDAPKASVAEDKGTKVEGANKPVALSAIAHHFGATIFRKFP